MNLSFDSCGFLGIYHIGVASCFQLYAPHVFLNKVGLIYASVNDVFGIPFPLVIPTSVIIQRSLVVLLGPVLLCLCSLDHLLVIFLLLDLKQ